MGAHSLPSRNDHFSWQMTPMCRNWLAFVSFVAFSKKWNQFGAERYRLVCLQVRFLIKNDHQGTCLKKISLRIAGDFWACRNDHFSWQMSQICCKRLDFVSFIACSKKSNKFAHQGYRFVGPRGQIFIKIPDIKAWASEIFLMAHQKW